MGDITSSWLITDRAIPQGAWLGPLLLNGLLIHKYIADITITDHIKNDAENHLQETLYTIKEWSTGTQNSMEINSKQTNEMVTSFQKDKQQLDPIKHNDTTLEIVQHF